MVDVSAVEPGAVVAQDAELHRLTVGGSAHNRGQRRGAGKGLLDEGALRAKGIAGVTRGQHLTDLVEEGLPRIGCSHQLIEALVNRSRAVPIEQQVLHHALERIAEQDALSCFGQLERAIDDGLTLDEEHVRRERLGRRRGNRKRLAEHALRRRYERGWQRIRRLGQHDGVGRERHAALANAREQPDAAVRLAGKRAGGHFARLLRDQSELRGDRLAGGERLERHRRVGDQLRAGDPERIEIHADEIGDGARRVGDRRVDVVGFAASHGAWMRQRHREGGVPHEHRAGGRANQTDRA